MALMAALAIQRRFAGVSRGGRPRFLPEHCFPGNQSGSAPTFVNKLVKRVLARASAAHFLHTGRNPLELRASGVELTAHFA